MAREDKFRTFQDKMLEHITRPRGRRGLSYLDEWEDSESLDSYKVRGGLKYLAEKGPSRLRVTPRLARIRAEKARFYGYYGHEIDLIAEADINFTTSTHYQKARYVRWIKVFETCREQGWDTYNFRQWEKAASMVAQKEGLLTIWEVIAET